MDFGLIIALTFLAYWKTDFLLFLVAGIVTFLFAKEWEAYYPEVMVIMVAFGCLMIAQAVLLAAKSGGASKGISQFRSIIDTIKGAF